MPETRIFKKHTSKTFMAAAATIFLLGADPIMAQSATPAAKPPVASTPAPAEKPMPELPAKTKSALKLAGLVTFVANSCPALKPDYARFKAAMAALGLTLEDLSKSDLKAVYIGYAARYGTDTTGNCEHARLAFGAKGTTLPDLFALR